MCNECKFCELPIDGPSVDVLGVTMHPACENQFQREMAAHERSGDAGAFAKCDHCKMYLNHDDATWSHFDLVMHESCKSEFLLCMAFPRVPDDETDRIERLKSYAKRYARFVSRNVRDDLRNTPPIKTPRWIERFLKLIYR